jgi:lipoprotein-anchoring transpeptidase ErfK/SrfK
LIRLLFSSFFLFYYNARGDDHSPCLQGDAGFVEYAMHSSFLPAFLFGALFVLPVSAEPLSLAPSRYASAPAAVLQQSLEPRYAERPPLGGGFIQFIFGGLGAAPSTPPAPSGSIGRDPTYGYSTPDAVESPEQAEGRIDAKYVRQRVAYSGLERPGTIVINTQERFLYLIEEGGTALRYGVGVGRPGFSWAGIKEVSMKRAWPDWRPPDEMLKRRPDLPGFMAGGPENPLGARALYLGSSLYRIHGSNEPWTIGTEVSSGCIRMRNEDVIDLYDRVKVGTKVVVI